MFPFAITCFISISATDATSSETLSPRPSLTTAATTKTVTRYLTMSSMLATSSPPTRFSKVSQPPPSSPLGPTFGSFSPVPRTPTRHRQYKNRDFSSPTPVQENPRKAFLREQFKKRCFERAQKARQDQVRNRRKSSSALSSDGFDFDDDAEMEESENQDTEEDVLNDEVCIEILSVRSPVVMELTPDPAI